MIPNTEKWQIGDILQVKQGDTIHFERIIQVVGEVLTIDMNPEENGEQSTQGLSDAVNISYELLPIWKVSTILSTYIPIGIAYSVANRFYGSDYDLSHNTFKNALSELGY